MLKTYTNEALPRQAQPHTHVPAQVANDLPAQHGLLRRTLAGPRMMHYNRLIALVVAANLLVLWVGLSRGLWWTAQGANLKALSNMGLANIALAVLVRQHYVINLFFRIATSAPTHWPLAIRRLLGKVYHFGGLHVGGAVAGTLWFGAFVAGLTGAPAVSLPTRGVTYLIVLLLLGIIGLAMPQVRAQRHDLFERSHRFGGWAALLLFWLQTLLLVNDQRAALTFGQALAAEPGFWVLLVVTFSIVLPWLRLRRVAVEIERPSSHVALARFDYGVTPFAGSSTAVSRNPLLEWHSFANVPVPGQHGFRLTISRAGDWTGRLIDEAPSHVWVKGIPTAGVGNIDKLFKRVVWIATGSGIGPTLPHLLAEEVPARLVWSTRDPRATYGDTLVDEILAVQPEALIWNTQEQGRPDLVQLAWEAVQDFDAEAVIVISNKKLTWDVVSGMESRGIPAYGAIWDS